MTTHTQSEHRTSVGDIITINQIDWTVAELIDGKIRLHREQVDGRSQTMDVTDEELQRLLARDSGSD